MSISPLNRTPLPNYPASPKASTAQKSDPSSSSKLSINALLAQITQSNTAVLTSLFSEKNASSKDDPSADNSPFTTPTSVNGSSNQAILQSLQSANPYAQLLQSTLNGSPNSTTDNPNSIFGSGIPTTSAYDSNSALLRALQNSGMKNSQVSALFNKMSAMSNTSDTSSIASNTTI